MKLLPTLKERKRYVVFEVISSRKVSLPEMKNTVNGALHTFLGTLGNAKAAPILLPERWNSVKQRFIVKVNNKYVDELKVAMMFIKKIKNTNVIVRSILTTSTIKKARQFVE
jgi:ribonuclease P/MRP protein subunit POP5